MKSLYAKILLWSLVTIVVAYLGVGANFFLATRGQGQGRGQGRGAGPGGPFRSSRLIADLAQRTWQDGGAQALAAFIEQATLSTRDESYLADSSGRDILTGRDLTPLLRSAGPRSRLPFTPPSGPFIVRAPSTDGQVIWIAVVNPVPEPYPWWTLAGILAAVALMAWLLNAHIVSPLAQLSGTVDRFGRGELSARSGSTRSDEIGQLSRSFDEMATRIDTLLTSERRLLQDVSHELRTPLARLRFAVEVARTDADRNAAIDRIKKECDRLTLLTDELLSFSASEGDPDAFRLQPTSLDSLLKEIADDCALEAAAKNCRIEITAAEVPQVAAARELLRRAIENVVRNAIRFSPEKASLDIALTTSADAVEITIRDHGPGIPGGAEEKIFQPFYRVEADRGRDTGGAGLGLAIARRALQWHHGTITAENANPGLRVRITLPVQAVTTD